MNNNNKNNQEESNSIISNDNSNINISVNNNNNNNINNKQDDQEQENDHDEEMVMPGFRFHPTEEELVEFYLRRKVEGKRFNVELITFLDLYRYDPWELPGLAAIGEKEWYFYVPRDRKYRNGDRPNRVTTSGYWKATGADRSIRSENLRSIGLKKTLVFYSGKAPKGIRTSWIMNEYRLPHHETERLQKAEISLCRVYKRAGVEDHHSLPSTSSSQHTRNQNEPENREIGRSKSQQKDGKKAKITSTNYNNNTKNINNIALQNQITNNSYTTIPPPPPTSLQEEEANIIICHSSNLSQNCPSSILFATNNNNNDNNNSSINPNIDDDLHKLVNINYSSQQSASLLTNNNNNNNLENNNNNPQYPNNNNVLPEFSPSLQPPAGFADRLWDWNSISEANKDFTNLFK
ncbi:hypothetical protein ABFS82_14G078100 [Erythranthe guttata]